MNTVNVLIYLHKDEAVSMSITKWAASYEKNR